MKKNNWFWNLVIILTVAVCILAFVLHYKNWVKIEEGDFQVVSGIYRQRIPLMEINSVDFVPKIPNMERKNGFSWLSREKGIFLDSITGAKIYVFVDDLKQRKIRVIHKDTVQLYLNLSDSLATQGIYDDLSFAIGPRKDPKP